MTPLDEQGKRFAQLLESRYELLGFLGKGGFASVYKVRNLTLGRFEALKVLHDARASEPDFAERFRREARVAASLEHPSIVKVFEFGEAGGLFWYSMQLVEGPTVGRELKIRTRLDEEKAIRIAIPILDALDYAHNRGVVHRDVKPDNIILDEWDRAYLMDFGIAKLDDDVVKTAAGLTFGSPAYLSPEQARGLPLDGRSDVYSLGTTLYQMLAGSVPFASPDRMATVTRRLHEDAEPLAARVPGVRPGLAAVVARSLAREREARYAAARDMKADLEAVLDEIEPRRAPTSGRTPLAMSDSGAATPGAWVGGTTSSGPMPTLMGRAAVSGGMMTTGAAQAKKASRRSAWIVAAACAAIAVLFVARPGSKNAEPAPPGPTAATATSAISATEPAVGADATATTQPPAAASSSPLVEASAPVPSTPASRHERRREPQAAIAGPAKAPAGRIEPPATRPTLPHRAKYPADVLETAEVTLTPQQSAECGGRSVGVTVVVDVEGKLKTKKVISPVSAACDALALDALDRYRFKPALDEDGSPIEARFGFAVRF